MENFRPIPDPSDPRPANARMANGRAPQPSRHWLALWAGSPAASAVLAGLVAFGMLLAFHQVMDGAVRQGDARRQADAMQAQASLRCTGMSALEVGVPGCARRLP